MPSAYPSGHPDPVVRAIIRLLDGWLNAIETGIAAYRMPSFGFVRSGCKPVWTEEQLDTLIRDIDAEVDQEVGRAPGTSVGAKAGPGFSRLAVPQRLALAQQLDAIIDGSRHNPYVCWPDGKVPVPPGGMAW